MFESQKIVKFEKEHSIADRAGSGRLAKLFLDFETELSSLSEYLERDAREGKIEQLTQHVRYLKCEIAAIRPLLRGKNPCSVFIQANDATVARSLIESRALRFTYFKRSLFSDPAWDILLYLMLTQAEQSRLTICDVARQTGIPLTTAIRWIEVLKDHGLVARVGDQTDRRRNFALMTENGATLMRKYLASTSLERPGCLPDAAIGFR